MPLSHSTIHGFYRLRESRGPSATAELLIAMAVFMASCEKMSLRKLENYLKLTMREMILPYLAILLVEKYTFEIEILIIKDKLKASKSRLYDLNKCDFLIITETYANTVVIVLPLW